MGFLINGSLSGLTAISHPATKTKSPKIVLIDGSRLAELMIEFGVAVATEATYTVKRIDNDFFESI
jgi:restriction system protein